MKKQDWILILCVIVVLAPFFIPATGFFTWFCAATAAHPYIMAFFKFAILATLGEMLALRIRKGVYNEPGFGVLPRMIVWGFLGMAIAMAMVIFKVGVTKHLLDSGAFNNICCHLQSLGAHMGQAWCRFRRQRTDEQHLRTSHDDLPQMHRHSYPRQWRHCAWPLPSHEDARNHQH